MPDAHAADSVCINRLHHMYQPFAYIVVYVSTSVDQSRGLLCINQRTFLPVNVSTVCTVLRGLYMYQPSMHRINAFRYYMYLPA